MHIKLADSQITPVNAESRRKLKISSGDSVKVYQKIQEKGKVRIQVFEGVVIATKHGTEPGASFTVRGIGTGGIAIEKIYPLYSPRIDKIEITKRTKVRRSKLYFLRDKTQKQFRYKLRRNEQVSESSVSEIGDAKAKEAMLAEEEEREKQRKQAELEMKEREEAMGKEEVMDNKEGAMEPEAKENSAVEDEQEKEEEK